MQDFRIFISVKVSAFLERFGYVKVLNRGQVLKGITDSDVLQASIFEALMSGIDMKSPAKAEHLQDIARGVVFKINKLNALSLKDFLKSVEQPIFLDRQITFAIGAGVASYWELQMKLLAQHLGIDVYEASPRPKAKSPALKDIEPIVEEIKRKLPKIDFAFGRLVNLRNAIVHGNFHQIRTAASESRQNEVKNSFKGKVMMANLANVADSVFLSEEKEFEAIKAAGLFGWFIETGNSALFETVIQEFQAACFLINAVVHIKGLSFNETADIYNHLCINGQRLTKEQKVQFTSARTIFDNPKGLLEQQIRTVEKALKA